MTTYVHYGSDFYNPSLAFRAVNKEKSCKPAEKTGLWGTRESSNFDDGKIVYGWKQWCKDTKYRPETLKKSFRFRLADTANLLTIEKPEDLLPLPKTAPWQLKDMSALKDIPPGEFPTPEQLHEFYSPNPCYLDFEKLMEQGVDAIELRNNHLFSRYLREWNCDCLLVLNPDVVVSMMEESDYVLMQPMSPKGRK